MSFSEEVKKAVEHRYYALADKNYALLRADPSHPSLRFREIEGLWSVRVGAHYRALAYRENGDFVWFWIGSHADYDKLMP